MSYKEIRDFCKDKKIKTYNQFKDEKCFKDEIKFNRNDDYDQVLEAIDKVDFTEVFVWGLFGKQEGRDWRCLQVAYANDIRTEIIDDVRLMFSNNYDELIKLADDETILKNSKFFKNVYKMPSKYAGKSEKKRQYSYSKMMSDYSDFKICILDVNSYLGISKLDNLVSSDMRNIIDISKFGYAEAKFAYETLAIYWNSYNNGIDGRSISKLLENDCN